MVLPDSDLSFVKIYLMLRECIYPFSKHVFISSLIDLPHSRYHVERGVKSHICQELSVD